MTSLNLQRIRHGLIAERTEQRDLKSSESLLAMLNNYSVSASGVVVTPDNALGVSAVYACVRVLAETIATLPLFVYRRDKDGGKERARDHQLYSLLHDAPNRWQTSVEWREMLVGHTALRGNGYSFIHRLNNGRVDALIPLHPAKIRPERNEQTGDIIYNVTTNSGKTEPFPSQEILHIKGLSSDGIIGLSPIGLMREAIGLSVATEQYGAKLFSNYGKPGGILEHPGKLGDDAAKRLAASWQTAHAGLQSAHKVAVLEEGMKWHQVGMSADDAQFLQTRQYQVTEIARMFRVPPHLIGDLSRATFSNVEQQSLDFVIHTIRPWLVRIEQALSRVLLGGRDIADGYFIEFQVDGLLRGDIGSRYSAYSIGKNNGWLSADDIRELENMNPLPGEQGKIYTVPLNMIPAEMLVQQMKAPPPAPMLPPAKAEQAPRAIADIAENREAETRTRLKAGANIRRNIRNANMGLFEDAARRIIRKETEKVRAGIHKIMGNRNSDNVREYISSFYDDYASKATGVMMPVILSYGRQVLDAALGEIGKVDSKLESFDPFANSYGEAYGMRHSARSRDQLLAVIDRYEELADVEETDLESMLVSRMDEWEANRPQVIAKRETIQAGGAFARLAWAAFGMGAVWIASPQACPICQELDGARVGGDENFIPNGGAVDFGDDESINYKNGIRHPPLHGGCECMTGPG